jgi:hypothetical protein
MSCAFDLRHYGEILEAARAGGYRFATFDERPRDGDLFLRHDVDLDLPAALEMAEVESGAGARATYFLMTESLFYNLASSEGAATLSRLRELGHAVGLHAAGAVNVMEAPFFDPDHYRSDSNQHWRSGCPHEELRARAFLWLQLLTHPEIWAYSGNTMAETMGAMLDSERERRLEQLRADDIDLG